MKRIDKIISEKTDYSRKEIKKIISAGLVSVNDKVIHNEDEKFDEKNITIKINNAELDIREYVYIILNKPKGITSSIEIRTRETILDLIDDRYWVRNLIPVGRLDDNATGLILLTDDGKFAHTLSNPKKRLKNIFEITVDSTITKTIINGFNKGVNIGNDEIITAQIEMINDSKVNVIIRDGGYYQIRKMFEKYGVKVIDIKRISMGNLYLPNDLDFGDSRELTQEELKKIQEES